MNNIGMVKNPLSVIAIFAGVAEISGAGVLPFISPENQELYIWFLILFPFSLIILFFFTLNWNHKVLYAPSDYQKDESFLAGIRSSSASIEAVVNLEQTIESNINSGLESSNLEDIKTVEGKAKVAKAITDSIKKSSFITINAINFTGNPKDIFNLLYVAFNSLDDLTNDIYFLLENHIKPFEYGFSWVLRSKNGNVIKNSRIITGSPKGIPCPDNRCLNEVGIEPGMEIFVTTP